MIFFINLIDERTKDGYSTQRDAQVILSPNQTLKYKFHLKEKLSSADSFSSIPK